jgi:DNA-binding GntR family transcriptional regulator
VESALRLDIIEGVLPPGQRLRTSDLTERYTVSATPLREALQRLAAENLVEIDPRFGATVASISKDDLHDIYWLRGVLESLALERSVAAADPAWKQQVTESWGRFATIAGQNDATTDPVGWSAAHRDFHEALFSASGSPWLERMLGILYDHSERYRMLSIRQQPRNTFSEHQHIYDAVVAGDVELAVDALRSHLHTTVTALETA